MRTYVRNLGLNPRGRLILSVRPGGGKSFRQAFRDSPDAGPVRVFGLREGTAESRANSAREATEEIEIRSATQTQGLRS
jgi:hypothetical protein